MRKRCNGNIAGYFTIEAALIIPFSMLIMIFMTFMSFYCYDRCILEQCAYAAALRGSSNRFTDVNQAYEEARTAAECLAAGKLFAVKELKSTVRVSGAAITVSYECKVNMPVGNWMEDVMDNVLSIEVSKRMERCKTVAIVRQLSWKE